MKPTKYFSSVQENLVADDLGWRVVPGSGAADCTPGDIIGEEWLGECKTHTTNAKSIFFSLDVWNKICKEAIMKHRNPVLFTDDGSQRLEATWCVCFSHSVDLPGLYVKPFNKCIKKNISFDHLEIIADHRVSCRHLPQGYSTLAYSLDWGGRNILIMPYLTFKELITC